MTVPAPPRPLTRPVALALILAALALASCARHLPTQATAPHQPRAITAPRLGASALAAEIVVTLAPGNCAQDVAGDHGAVVLDGSTGCIAALSPADGANADLLNASLLKDPRVLSAEINGTLEVAEARQKSWAFDDGIPSLQGTVEQPAAAALGLAVAHGASMGNGVRVAILDTGVDPSHELFAGRIVATADFLDPSNTGALDIADGVDNNGDGTVDEAWGHGSHVAGIVTLTAPGARLVIGRVLDAEGRGDVLGVVAGIYWAIEQGARVINLSLGTTTRSPAIEAALEHAEDLGVLVVAAAGNRGAEYPQEYPAKYKDVFAVAAADCDDHPAPFTSFGKHVDLIAPGIAIRSAYPGNRYRLWSGTSMAAPWASGAVALVMSAHPEWELDEVVERLTDHARRIKGGTSSQREKLGKGALSVGAALAADLPPGAGSDDSPIELRDPR